jgi:aspartyl-tRNA(Asn)/glutamyl-tRNA(Gln) amidotransferase subunit B
MRFDVNVSLRNDLIVGNRCEIKNLNTLRGLATALDYEVKRHIALLDRHGQVEKETRGFHEAQKATYLLRKKEDTQDYRYMPDPNLPPVILSETWIETIRQSLPELPDARRKRLAQKFGLSIPKVDVLLNNENLLAYYQKVAEHCDPEKAFNW